MKFVWDIDGRKWNFDEIVYFSVTDGECTDCVGEKLTPNTKIFLVIAIVRQTLTRHTIFVADSLIEAKRYIDDITSSDFDKVGEPLVKVILEYMKSYLMTNKGEYHA